MSDLISRQAAIDSIQKEIDKYYNEAGGGYYLAENAIDTLKALPSSEPERKKGKWENYIADTGVEHWRVIRCSECEKVAIERYNYCPHCGADMREEK